MGHFVVQLAFHQKFMKFSARQVILFFLHDHIKSYKCIYTYIILHDIK
jgi:hypothetical protein